MMAMTEMNLSSNAKSTSRIPRLLGFQRSASFHNGVKKYSMSHEEAEEDRNEAQDELASLSSVCSNVSCIVASSTSYKKAVESASDFRYRKHSLKYALHCSNPQQNYFGAEGYLTPTQRANKNIRQLKLLLKESEINSGYKDFEIHRLTRELVAVRMEHAQWAKRTNIENGDHLANATPSLADSGLFEDISSHTNQSKDLHDRDPGQAETGSVSGCWTIDKNRLIALHVEKFDELKRQHASEIQDIRTRFTDRLEMALCQLGESNTRYASLLGRNDATREDLRRAEAEVNDLRQKIVTLEATVSKQQQDMETREITEYENRERDFLQIDSLTEELTAKNQLFSELKSKINQTASDKLCKSLNSYTVDATKQQSCSMDSIVAVLQQQERHENPNVDEIANLKDADNIEPQVCDVHSARQPSADYQIILKFLRSAIFYLLTDNDNAAEHLRAVQSILEFNPEERAAVERAGRLGYS